MVDDCSPDETRAVLAARFAGDGRVHYLRQTRNRFQAAARNRGAAAATGDYFFFLDDDNLLRPGCLAALVDAFARHPDAGLVAPMAVHRRPGRTGVVWTLGSDFSRWTSRPRDVKANCPEAEVPATPVDWTTTYSPNGFMVPRAVFVAVGGFDEDYVQIFEESDFGWRIVASGRTAWICTHAVTDHLGFLEPGCVPELRRLSIGKPYRTRCVARNRMRFARRHFSFLQALAVAGVFAPLSAVWYGVTALRHGRPDIARA